MFRIITLINGKSSKKYKAEFGDLETARVTITKNKKIKVSDDIDSRDDTALFEAIFDNRSRVSVVKAEYDETGAPLFIIGKLEQSSEKVELKNLKIKKLKEIASNRYDAEISGITINGVFFNTDRNSISSLFNEYILAVNDNNYSTLWKSNKGFITLTSVQIIDIVKKVKEYIQSCFNKEKELIDKINSAKSINEVNNIHW